MPLIDSHCHLDQDAYGADLRQVIGRAQSADLERLVLIGQWAKPQPDAEIGKHESSANPLPARASASSKAPSVERSGLWQARETLLLARTAPAFFSATAGVHPHDAALASDSDWLELEALCSEPDIVAVGECGLDFHYDRSPREVQREQFLRQIELAKKLHKPLVVHSREADQETAEMLKAHLGPESGVIHCFTSDWNAAQAYLDLGMSISFSGVVTFKSAAATRDAAVRVPLERILVETDAPFLAPVPMRGKRNEPALVVHTARLLAEIRGISLEEFANATSANARRALHLPSQAG